MKLAYLEAKKALNKNEIPVGAVIVFKDGTILAKSHNLKEKNNDVTAHAEILAIKKASEKLNNWRLSDCKIFVTLEPCMMCSSAIFQSRIKEIFIGVIRENKNEPTMLDFKDYMFENNISFKTGIYDKRIKGLLDKNFEKIR